MGFQQNLNAPQTLSAQQVGRAVATHLADNSYLLVWQDTDPLNPSSERDIFAQRIDTDGVTPMGDIFRVNAITAGSQQRPYAIALPDGGYVITWTSFAGATFTSTSVGDIYARRFALDGTPFASTDQLINSATAGNQMQSRGFYDDASGQVVIAWTSGGGTGGGYVVGHGYQLTATGLLASDTGESPDAPLDFRTASSVTGRPGGTPFIRNATDLADGRFAVGIYVNYQDSSGVIVDEDSVLAFGDNSNGPTLSIPIETSAAVRSTGPSVAALDGGTRFVATWSEESTGNLGHPVAKFAIMNANATALGTPVQLATDAYGPTATQLPDGTPLTGPIQAFASTGTETFLAPTVLPNEQSARGGGGAFVFAAIHDGAGPITLDLSRPAVAGYGTPGGTEITFNASQAPADAEQRVGRAVATHLNDGSNLMVWQDLDQNRTGIFARHYAADGTTPLGAVFQVNTITAGIQSRPNVVALPDNGYVIDWTSIGADGNGDIYARRFASNGTPFGSSDFLVNAGATSGNQLSSRGFYSNLGTPSPSDDEVGIGWTNGTGATGGALAGRGLQLTTAGLALFPGSQTDVLAGTDFSTGAKPGGVPFFRNIVTVSNGATIVGGFEVQYFDANGVLQDSD